MSELKRVNSSLLNMDEASNLLGIKKSTLYALVMRREIQVVKIGKLNRFRHSDLDKFIENHTQNINSLCHIRHNGNNL